MVENLCKLFLAALLVTGSISVEECDFTELCGGGDSGGLEEWFKVGKLYKYSFHTKVALDVKHNSGEGVAEFSTVDITGELEVVRGSGDAGCTSSFRVTKASATMSEIEGERTELDLGLEDDPTVFPFVSGETPDIKLCVSQVEDKWKTNIRRALALHLATLPERDCVHVSRKDGARLSHIECNELLQVSEFYHLAGNVTTNTEIKFLGATVTPPGHKWNLNNTPLFLTTSAFDYSPNGPTTCSQVLSDFDKLVAQLCSHTHNPKSLLEYGDRMRRILPLIPVAKLKEAYAHVKGNICLEGLGIKAFLDMVAKAPSDDTLEFIVDLITNNDANLDSDVFTTFLWTAAMQPLRNSFDDDFVRYAGQRGVKSMEKLLDPENLHHSRYGVSDSDFVLSMLAFRNKVLVPATPTSEYDEKLLLFMVTLSLTLDKATVYEVTFTLENNLINGTEKCQVGFTDDFERLRCHAPCDLGHEGYLKDLLNNPAHPEDLKITAYLHMRKCYREEWREIVKNYVQSPAANKDVKHFILQHVKEELKSEEGSRNPQVIKDDEDLIEGMLGGQGEGMGGYGGSRKIRPGFSLTQQLYGKGSTVFFLQGNLVHGKSFLPRLATLVYEYYSSTGNLSGQRIELEILRLDSKTGKGNEFLVTVRQDVVAIYANTIVLEQEKLLQLLHEGRHQEVEKFAGKFLKYLSSVNNRFANVLFKNHEILRTIAMQTNQEQTIFNVFGLPVKTGSHTYGLFSLNYTFDSSYSPEAGRVHTFRLNPAIALQNKKYVSVGLGHNEVQGYQLVTEALVQFNVEIQVETQYQREDKKTLNKAKVRVNFKKSGSSAEEDAHAIHIEAEAARLSRFQYVDSYTKYRETEHILLEGMLAEAPARDEIDFGDYCALLKGSNCERKLVLEGFLFSDLAAHFGVKSYCELPTLIFQVEYNIETFKLYFGTKLNSGNVSASENHFGVEAIITRDIEKRQIGGYIILVIPKRKYELSGRVSLYPGDYSLILTYRHNGLSSGVEVYAKAWQNPWDGVTIPLGHGTEFGATAYIPYFGGNFTLLKGSAVFPPKSEPYNFHFFLETDVKPYTAKINVLDTNEVDHFTENVDVGTDKVQVTLQKNITIDFQSFLPDQWTATFLPYHGQIVGDEEPKRLVTLTKTQMSSTHGGTFLISDILSLHDYSTVPHSKVITTTGDVQFLGNPSHDFFVKMERVEPQEFPVKCDDPMEIKIVLGLTLKKSLKELKVNVVHSLKYEWVNQSYTACQSIGGDDIYEVDFAKELWFKLHKEKQQPGKVKLLELGTNLLKTGIHGKYQYSPEEIGEVNVSVKFHRPAENILLNSVNKLKLTSLETYKVKYDGTFELQTGLPESSVFTLNGVILVLEPSFDIEISNDDWEDPLEVSLAHIEDENTAKYVKLNAKNKQRTFFNSSFKVLKERSPEGYFYQVNAHIPHNIDITGDVGPEGLNCNLHSNVINWKVEGKASWSHGGKISPEGKLFFIFEANAHRLSDGLPATWNLAAEFEKLSNVSKSSSELIFNRYLPGKLPDNRRFTLGSTISVGNISQQTNLFFQLFPTTDQRETSIKAEVLWPLLDDSGSKLQYLFESERHLLYNQNQAGNGDPLIVAGEYGTIKAPFLDAPITTLQELTLTEFPWKNLPGNSSIILFETGGEVKLKLGAEFSQLFFQDVNFDFNATALFAFKEFREGEYTGEQENPEMSEFQFQTENSRKVTVTRFDIAPNPIYENAFMDQRSVSVEWETPVFTFNPLTLSATYTKPNKAYLLSMGFNKSASDADPSQVLGLDYDRIEAKLRTVKKRNFSEFDEEKGNDTQLQKQKTDLTWTFVASEEEEINSWSGVHQQTVFFEGWRNFEHTSSTQLNLKEVEYNYTDKFYFKYLGGDGGCGYVSNLVELTTMMRGNYHEINLKVMDPLGDTKATFIRDYTPALNHQEFDHSNYTLKTGSATNPNVPDNTAVYILSTKTPPGSQDEDYKFMLFHNYEFYKQGTFRSHLQQRFVEDENKQFSAVYVKNSADFLHLGATNMLEFSSVSTIIYSKDEPLLVHYDFFMKSEDTVQGSLSASAPNLDGPTILQAKVQVSGLHNTFEEVAVRVGKLDLTKCTKDTVGLAELATFKESLTIQDLTTFYNSLLNCPRCRPSSTLTTQPTCEAADGHFVLQTAASTKKIDAVTLPADETSGFEKPREFHRISQGVWSQDKCWAERSTSNNSSYADISDSCDATLDILSPCFINREGCGVAEKSRNFELWTHQVKKMRPMKMTLLGEGTVWILAVFFAP